MKLNNNIQVGIFGSTEPEEAMNIINRLVQNKHWIHIEYTTGNLAELLNMYTDIMYEPDKQYNHCIVFNDGSLEAITAINNCKRNNIPIYLYGQINSNFLARNIVIVNYYTYEPRNNDYVVYIGRGKCDKANYNSNLGNPYTVAEYGRGFALNKFKENLPMHKINMLANHLKTIPQDKRIVLMCWCKPNPCHGDVIKQQLEKLL